MSDNQQKGPFSGFTINANRASGDKQPTLRGVVTVIDTDGTPVSYDHAMWGPNAPQEAGKREYYSIELTPQDPALAARQAQIRNGKLPMPEIANPIDALTLDRVGRGVVFETSEAERQAAAAAGKKVRSFFGSVLVLLPSGSVQAIDLAARKVEGHGFHSGWAQAHDVEAARAARARKAAASGPRHG